MKKIISGACLVCSSVFANGWGVITEDGFNPRIGDGTNQAMLEKFASPFEGVRHVQLEEANLGVEATITYRAINSHNELRTFLNSNTSAQARAAFGNVNGAISSNMTFMEENVRSSDETVFAFDICIVGPGKEVDSELLRFKDLARQTLIRSVEEFHRLYGDYYFCKYRTGARAFGYFRISDQNEARRVMEEFGVQGSVSYQNFSGERISSAELTNQNGFFRALSSFCTSSQVYYAGGPVNTTLPSEITSHHDLANIVRILYENVANNGGMKIRWDCNRWNYHHEYNELTSTVVPFHIMQEKLDKKLFLLDFAFNAYMNLRCKIIRVSQVNGQHTDLPEIQSKLHRIVQIGQRILRDACSISPEETQFLLECLFLEVKFDQRSSIVSNRELARLLGNIEEVAELFDIDLESAISGFDALERSRKLTAEQAALCLSYGFYPIIRDMNIRGFVRII